MTPETLKKFLALSLKRNIGIVMAKQTKRDIEAILAFQLRALKIDHETQFRFHPERRWKFDFAIPKFQLGIEVQGLAAPTYSKRGKLQLGGHQSIPGIKNDLEKYDEALRLGWKVYCCEQDMVITGRALKTIQILIGQIQLQDVKQRVLAV